MFAVVVDFSIKPDRAADFLELVRENARTSLQHEDGCCQFDVLSDPEQPYEVLLYELYSDAQAFRLHLQTEHFLAFDAAIADMVAQKTIRTFRQVAQ